MKLQEKNSSEKNVLLVFESKYKYFHDTVEWAINLWVKWELWFADKSNHGQRFETITNNKKD